MFKPKISVTIPNTSNSVTITDVTGFYPTDSTGYEQGTGLPENGGVWNKKVQAQFLGETPSNLIFTPYTDNELPSASLPGDFKDGLWLITQYFCQEITGLGYTLNAAKTVMTKTDSDAWVDPLGIFEGVYGLLYRPSDEGFLIDDISVITALTTSSITLSKELTGATTNSNLWRIYKASTYVLVMNKGEGELIADIGDMALNGLNNGVGCDTDKSVKLWNRLLLKYSAQINLACGNYAKAHNAAVLFGESCTNPNPACTSCD